MDALLHRPAAVRSSGRRRGRAGHAEYTPDWQGDILEVGPLKLAAPPGETLHTGVYDPVTYAYARDGAHAALDVDGCDPFEARFDVRDLAWGADGLPIRLWVVYEQHCYRDETTYGELRLNEPDDGPASAVPGLLRFGAVEPGGVGEATPVAVYARSATTVSSVDVTGNFPIAEDDCSGHALAAGDSCQVWVRFTPIGAGTYDGSLVAHLRDGAVTVPLQGFSYGGASGVTLHGDPGEPLTHGGDLGYSPANANIWVDGSDDVRFEAWGADGAIVTGDLAAPPGQALTPGAYSAAVRTSTPGRSGPGFDIAVDGSGCNTDDGSFAVTELARRADGGIARVRAEFTQHCDHEAPALHGVVAWRAGNTTPPAPWMTPTTTAAPPTTTAAPPATAASPAPPTSSAASPLASAAPALPARRPAIPARADCAHLHRVTGTRRADHLTGTKRGDCLRGGKGRDVLRGRAGNDVLVGGPGRDVLDCGPGRDLAVAGKGDRVRGCERVVRG